MKSNKDRFKVVIFFDGNETTAYLLKNEVPVKDAVAICHPDDKFSMAVGSQLALARLFEKKQKEVFSDDPLDKFVKFLLAFGEHIAETENKEKSQVKEVKRKAKIGEWIKVVNPQMSYGDYKKGDIFKVKEISHSMAYIVVKNDEDCDGLFHSEYVVLEGYKNVQ